MAYLNSRYTRLTLNDSTNPSNYLKGAVFWVGPTLNITSGFLIEPFYSPELEFVGIPGIQIYKNNLTIQLGGISNAEYVALTSIAESHKAAGRMIVIPRPAEGVALAIAHTNQVSAESMMTASSAHSSYPDDNLGNLRLYSYWRSATAALTSITLTADLGSGKDIDVFALLGNNLTDSGTFRAQSGEASNFSTTEYDSGVSPVAVFDTTYSSSVLRPSAPPFGRHLLWMPGLTQARALWPYEAIVAQWHPEQPIQRLPQPTYPPTWEVELKFKMCQD